jgi:hypothetical protein
MRERDLADSARRIDYSCAPDGRPVAIFIGNECDAFEKVPPDMDRSRNSHARETYKMESPSAERTTKSHVTDCRGPRSDCPQRPFRTRRRARRNGG